MPGTRRGKRGGKRVERETHDRSSAYLVLEAGVYNENYVDPLGDLSLSTKQTLKTLGRKTLLVTGDPFNGAIKLKEEYTVRDAERRSITGKRVRFYKELQPAEVIRSGDSVIDDE